MAKNKPSYDDQQPQLDIPGKGGQGVRKMVRYSLCGYVDGDDESPEVLLDDARLVAAVAAGKVLQRHGGKRFARLCVVKLP